MVDTVVAQSIGAALDTVGLAVPRKGEEKEVIARLAVEVMFFVFF